MIKIRSDEKRKDGRVPRLSFSSLSLYEFCPYAYYMRNILNLPEENVSRQMKRGKRVHEKLQGYATNEGQNKETLAHSNQLSFVETPFYLDCNLNITVKAEKAVFVGIPDYVRVYPEQSTIRIVDWKTGKSSGDVMQLYTYALPYKQMYNPTTVVGSFVYLDKKRDYIKDTVITDFHIDLARTRIIRIAQMIYESTFERTPSWVKCNRLCNYKISCMETMLKPRQKKGVL